MACWTLFLCRVWRCELLSRFPIVPITVLIISFQPFDQSTPFVERDGYAWCVGCHTKRTAKRCLKCKRPVIDEVVVTALGREWHAACFVCAECGGDFGNEGRFFVREGGKGGMAVCEGCEGRRLKA